MLGVYRDLARQLCQRHAGFLRCSIALHVVAFEAAGHQILPGGLATAAARDHMIEREAAGGKLNAAILASVTVAQKNSFPRHGPVLPRHAAVLDQPDDCRNRNIDLRRPDREGRDLLNDGGTLENQGERAPRRSHIDGFVARVDDQAQSIEVAHNPA